jgi:hypothetical protein
VTPVEETVETLIAKNDLIGALCLAVKQAGLTMTLHGRPVDAEGLRIAAIDSVATRLADRMVLDDARAELLALLMRRP